MGDTSLDTPRLKGELYQVNTFRDNNSVAENVDLGKGGRAKKFISYDSLRFEKERLETFIDWPLEWLNPVDLARDRLFYRRTADLCACVFCRGIMGAWENGSTPRCEHKHHFPECPFINGQPVGNIPLAHSQSISRITPSPEAAPALPLSMDVCGTGRSMPGSYPESKPPKKVDLALASLGLQQCSGPKRKDFLSVESRKESFTQGRGWPDKVKQTPKELAEAGFYYCGLSDHVRCFHCGNGLRNWGSEDDTWEEHARWYPECNYVLVKRGQEFTDKVRREKPPYLRSQPVLKTSSSSLALPTITEREFDLLTELDIIKVTVAMGFPADKVRPTLRRKLEQTGLPFFNLEACIEAVPQYLEKEARLTLRESLASLELDVASQQGAKMQALQSVSERQATASSSSLLTTTTTTTTTAGAVSSPPSTSSAGSSSQHDLAASNTEKLMETESSPITPTHKVLRLADQVIGMAEQALNAAPTSFSSPTPNPSAGHSLVTSTTSTPSNPSAAIASSLHQITPVTFPTFSKPPDAVMEKVAEKTLPSTEKPSVTGKPHSWLKKIRDSHMCKVCMDAKIDMVFLPCSHMATCSSCALALSQCPICRNDIKYAISPFVS